MLSTVSLQKHVKIQAFAGKTMVIVLGGCSWHYSKGSPWTISPSLSAQTTILWHSELWNWLNRVWTQEGKVLQPDNARLHTLANQEACDIGSNHLTPPGVQFSTMQLPSFPKTEGILHGHLLIQMKKWKGLRLRYNLVLFRDGFKEAYPPLAEQSRKWCDYMEK